MVESMSEIVAIVGSRSLPHQAWPWMKDILDHELADVDVAVFLSGGAKGADRLAERYVHQRSCPWTDDGKWAFVRGFPGCSVDRSVARGFMLVILPDYQTSGRQAPLIRNTAIAQNCSWLFAFVDGKMSNGTSDVLRKASALRRLVTVHTWEG